jgi:energy-coupling factor transport system ATP-binding protein
MLKPPAPAAVWNNVRVRYPYSRRDALGPVNLSIHQGERLLLLGSSGSGKSTLLHTLTGLIPTAIPAEVDGSIRLFGEDVASRPPPLWAASVAHLFQNPEQTLCGMRVEDEIAFALENLGLPAADIEKRVGDALAKVGLAASMRGNRTTRLSGGEKQIVALAALVAQGAQLLVVDEPTAHLAPAASNLLRELLLAPDSASSVVIVDHRLDGLLDMIDRVALLEADGTILDGGEPRGFFRREYARLASQGIWMPLAMELDAALSKAGILLGVPPLTIAEALDGLSRLDRKRLQQAIPIVRSFAALHMAAPVAQPTDPEPIALLEKASCAPLFGPTVLRDVNLALRRGERLAILGRNGAGKSTLGASLAGLLRLKKGSRTGPMGALSFQNPENQFLAGSVRDEVHLALPDRADVRQHRADEVLAAWGLADLAQKHPFELSQGQKRRLALATLTCSGRWPLLVLDEPTAGLDAAGKSALEAQISRLAAAGHAVAVITHDLDFALRTCDRAVILDQGSIVADGPTAELMRDHALMLRSGLEQPALINLLRWLEQTDPC